MARLARWVAATAAVLAVSHAQEPDGKLLRDRAVAVLRQGLRGTEFWPAMHAAEGLTKAGLGPEVVTALAERLGTETDDQRRCGLAREQVRAGKEGPVAVLAAILADPASTGRVHAAESLFKVNRVGDRQAVEKALDAGVPGLEIMAAAALARQGDTAVLGRVRARLGASDVAQRRLAAWVLGQVGGAEDQAPIRPLAETETDPLSRSFFWNALARLKAPDALAVVLGNLGASDAGVRAYAAETVGVCGGTEHLPRLTVLLTDPELDVRIRAAEAIVVILGRTPPSGGPP